MQGFLCVTSILTLISACFVMYSISTPGMLTRTEHAHSKSCSKAPEDAATANPNPSGTPDRVMAAGDGVLLEHTAQRHNRPATALGLAGSTDMGGRFRSCCLDAAGAAARASVILYSAAASRAFRRHLLGYTKPCCAGCARCCSICGSVHRKSTWSWHHACIVV